MTREEANKERALKVLEMFLDKQCSIERTLNHMDTTDVEIWDAVYMATKALSAEPCEDESGSEKPNNCEDAISRQAVIDILRYECSSTVERYLRDKINALPSITPKQKMGHWVNGEHCSECGCDIPAYIIDWEWQKDMDAKYCPQCGAKMSNIPTGSNCTDCVLDGTDACSRGAGRAVDGRVCEDFVGESEDK